MATYEAATERDRPASDEALRHAAFFHELDAWTEYWDVYHLETKGHYYLGCDAEPGLLSLLIPGRDVPPVYSAWRRRALEQDAGNEFQRCAREEPVASAVVELDDLVAEIFTRHFGDPADLSVRSGYLRAIYGAGSDTLPPATERAARIGPEDPRRRTAGRHTIEADMMWFVWALELEAARAVRPSTTRLELHALLLAGIAIGSAANFALRGHRRTRPEYGADETTQRLLLERGIRWAEDVDGATNEVHQLFQIREWGSEASP